MDKIQETNIHIIKRYCKDHYIDNDLFLIDNIKRIPIPDSARRTNLYYYRYVHPRRSEVYSRHT